MAPGKPAGFGGTERVSRLAARDERTSRGLLSGRGDRLEDRWAGTGVLSVQPFGAGPIMRVPAADVDRNRADGPALGALRISKGTRQALGRNFESFQRLGSFVAL